MGLKIKKNGKIISLSESDLKRITMKVLREQEEVEVNATADSSELEAELEGMDEDNPDPGLLDKILQKVEGFVDNMGDLPKNLRRFKRKIKNIFKKHKQPNKFKKLGTSCPKW
jgi:DUF4097 and DUF4098 domain-containing protein YvlB